jgi:hypothetical protein
VMGVSIVVLIIAANSNPWLVVVPRNYNCRGLLDSVQSDHGLHASCTQKNVKGRRNEFECHK